MPEDSYLTLGKAERKQSCRTCDGASGDTELSPVQAESSRTIIVPSDSFADIPMAELPPAAISAYRPESSLPATNVYGDSTPQRQLPGKTVFLSQVDIGGPLSGMTLGGTGIIFQQDDSEVDETEFEVGEGVEVPRVDIPEVEDLFPTTAADFVNLSEMLKHHKEYVSLGKIQEPSATVQVLPCDESEHRIHFRRTFDVSVKNTVSYWAKPDSQGMLVFTPDGPREYPPEALDAGVDGEVKGLLDTFLLKTFDDSGYYKGRIPDESELWQIAKETAKFRRMCPSDCRMEFEFHRHKAHSVDCGKAKPPHTVDWVAGDKPSDRIFVETEPVEGVTGILVAKKIYLTFTIYLTIDMEFWAILRCVPE